ncbi:hypothetical protein LX36DRAFT_58947 [Colletotrichum falcatum]|nr:hypothetical protein LX36DRAFT_58947 [Colletotrichum falcatum]
MNRRRLSLSASGRQREAPVTRVFFSLLHSRQVRTLPAVGRGRDGSGSHRHGVLYDAHASNSRRPVGNLSDTGGRRARCVVLQVVRCPPFLSDSTSFYAPLTVPKPIIAVQANLPAEKISVGISLVSSSQFIGGAISPAMGNAIFRRVAEARPCNLVAKCRCRSRARCGSHGVPQSRR